jgi:hypothetical protein
VFIRNPPALTSQPAYHSQLNQNFVAVLNSAAQSSRFVPCERHRTAALLRQQDNYSLSLPKDSIERQASSPPLFEPAMLKTSDLEDH